MTAEAAPGHMGLILALELAYVLVPRLRRCHFLAHDLRAATRMGPPHHG